MKLSIIIPIYKVEQYLQKCVDSVLSQDYEDYEIILVDDGSPDRCPQICDEFATKSQESRAKSQDFPHVSIIHRKNGGLSAARNSGIEVAQGEYIMFVDSDDYIEPNVLSGLMRQVEREQLDVLRFDYQNVRTADGQESRVKSQELKYEVFEPNKTPRYIDQQSEIVDGETYLNTRMGYACYAWQFILRRDIILNLKSEIINHKSEIDDCLFTPGLHFEDVDWLPRMMLRAKRVNSTPTIVYNYFIRQGSITKTQGDKEKIRKNLEDRMKIIATYSAYLKQHPSCYWLKNMQSNMAAGVLTTVAQSFYQERKEYISRLKALNVLPLSLADQGKSYVRKARLINLSPKFMVELLHLKN